MSRVPSHSSSTPVLDAAFQDLLETIHTFSDEVGHIESTFKLHYDHDRKNTPLYIDVRQYPLAPTPIKPPPDDTAASILESAALFLAYTTTWPELAQPVYDKIAQILASFVDALLLYPDKINVYSEINMQHEWAAAHHTKEHANAALRAYLLRVQAFLARHSALQHDPTPQLSEADYGLLQDSALLFSESRLYTNKEQKNRIGPMLPPSAKYSMCLRFLFTAVVTLVHVVNVKYGHAALELQQSPCYPLAQRVLAVHSREISSTLLDFHSAFISIQPHVWQQIICARGTQRMLQMCINCTRAKKKSTDLRLEAVLKRESEHKHKLLAFMQASHPRLGHDSVAKSLPPKITQKYFAWQPGW